MLICSTTFAESEQQKKHEVRINLGVKSMTLGIAEILPFPFTLTADLDLGR